jgi:hypothetical protein
MITIPLRTHLDHMDLKNWALSLFNRGRPLHTYGFKNIRATPSIVKEPDTWTPDLIVWSNKIILIIECKAGEPCEEDLVQARRYAMIPKSSLEKWTGLSDFTQRVILLYFKDKLESNQVSKEELLSKASLEKDITVWACERGFNIVWITGSLGDDQLDSLLRGGMDIAHLPLPQIEIQPDSPMVLLEKLLFTKLWERAFRFKDTRFTIVDAREILENHNYALERHRERRLRDAIASAKRHGLCSEEQFGQVWKLDVILDSPASIQNYLKKLGEIVRYPELGYFYSET